MHFDFTTVQPCPSCGSFVGWLERQRFADPDKPLGYREILCYGCGQRLVRIPLDAVEKKET